MTVVEMVAIVAAGTQFAKNTLAKINVEVKGVVAVIMTVIISLGVVLYKYISEGQPITLQAFVDFVQVVVAANAGYSLLKVARNPD